MKNILSFGIVFILLFIACTDNKEALYIQPTQTEEGIMAVIEIPAGTNHKIEYNPQTKQFENDTLDGAIRVIDFLPYPGNYGFIPSTKMDEDRGGDGDALDVLVIGESLPTGTSVATRPIGVLLLKDRGEIDSKIIALPADSSKCIVKAANYEDFYIKYNAAHHIIQEWFMNYKGLGRMELVGWRDEQYALSEIAKWSKKD